MAGFAGLFKPRVEADDEGEYSFDEIQARADCPLPNGRFVDLETAYHKDFSSVTERNRPARMKIAKRVAERQVRRGEPQ